MTCLQAFFWCSQRLKLIADECFVRMQVCMSLLFIGFCLCVCPRARASGGLILIAHLASKCLCHMSIFLLQVTSSSKMGYFAWRLITIRFATLITETKFVLFLRYICTPVFWPRM